MSILIGASVNSLALCSWRHDDRFQIDRRSPRQAVNQDRMEFYLQALRTLVALSVATLATDSASPGTTTAVPPAAGMGPKAVSGAGSMSKMDPRMKSMQ